MAIRLFTGRHTARGLSPGVAALAYLLLGFWALVVRYPLTERARGYLMALDHRAGCDPEDEPEVD